MECKSFGDSASKITNCTEMQSSSKEGNAFYMVGLDASSQLQTPSN